MSERPRLIGRTGPAGTRLLGFGSAQGNRVVTNDDIAAMGVDTNDEWIRQRVGIVERRLAEIVEEVAGVAVDDVTVEKSFVDDLDIDSLSMVEIAVQAEDKFGVKIPDDELANLKTVGDAVDYITKNTV
jgi:acyl carrier protein